MKKNNSLKKFGVLAQKSYKYSKDNNLGWTWHDAQRWTSKNLYQAHKTESYTKLKRTNITSEVREILQPTIIPEPVKKEHCFNPFFIPSSDLEDINWWMLPDEIEKFDPNLKMAIEIDGLINTGIVKKSSIKDLATVREEMRKTYTDPNNKYTQLVFKILVAPNKQDDGKACSYYVLLTNEGSAQDMMSDEGEIEKYVSEEQIPDSVKIKRESRKQKQEEIKSRNKTKKAVRERQRPQQVQVTTQSPIELESEKYKRLNETLALLRKDYDDKILTKKEYLARQSNILKKFEDGGTT